METEINEAIKAITKKAAAVPPNEAMHLSQAVLNLMHALQVKKQTELLNLTPDDPA
jgi:hypothetical protein